MHLKTSSTKWRPFCSGGDELMCHYIVHKKYIRLHDVCMMHITLRNIYTIAVIPVGASKSKLGRNQNNWMMFCVHTDLSLSPRYLSRTSMPELVTMCSDILRCRRLSSFEVAQCICSMSPLHMVSTTGYQNGHGFGWPWIQASDVV